jgi:hypothetical protein
MKNINHETIRTQEMKKNIIQNDRHECETLPAQKFTPYIGSEDLSGDCEEYYLLGCNNHTVSYPRRQYSFHQTFFWRKWISL